MDGIVLLEYVASADDVHIVFSSPTITYNHRLAYEVDSAPSAQLSRQPGTMPETDYDSTINVHICPRPSQVGLRENPSPGIF